MRAALVALIFVVCCSDKSKSTATDHEVPEPVDRDGSDMAHGGKAHAEPELIQIAPDMMRDLRVTMGKVEARAAGATVSALGELHVNEAAYAEVAAAVSARVAKVLAKPGDVVKVGQVLAQLNSPELGESRAGVDAAQAGCRCRSRCRAW